MKMNPTAKKVALVGGGLLLILFFMKKSGKFPNIFNVTVGQGGGDIDLGTVNLGDTGDYVTNEIVQGYNSGGGMADGYMPLFGMLPTVGQGAPVQDEGPVSVKGLVETGYSKPINSRRPAIQSFTERPVNVTAKVSQGGYSGQYMPEGLTMGGNVTGSRPFTLH